MQVQKILTAFIFLLFAQTITAQSPNPYNSIGKASKIVTLTKGEYEEFFDEDNVQRIGSALVNVNTMKVVSVNLTKQEQRQLDNAQESRFLSVDPLASNYPYYTPYQFAGNKPIMAIDLDGLEEFVVIKELYKSGNTKSISIQYAVQKENVKNKINAHFREVLGTNPDGTTKLGAYLTNQKVIRIVQSSDGTEKSTPDSKLTPQEQGIVNQKSNNEYENSTEEAWGLTIGKTVYLSETDRNSTTMLDKVASKRFPNSTPTFNNTRLTPHTTLSNFSGSNNYYYGGSYNPMGGQLGSDLTSSLDNLATQLKNAENIQSITINLNQGINANAGTSEYNTAQQYGQAAVANITNLLQAKLKGTGIKVNAGTTITTPNETVADMKNQGKSAGVNIQIK